MRTDLTRACLTCGLRLPESESACPRCAGSTLETRDPRVWGKRSFWRKLTGAGVSHPLRDLLLFAPALLGAGVALIGAFATLDWPREPNGFAAGLMIVGFVAGFDGAALAIALLWFVWANLVLAASLFWNVGSRPPRLRPVPVPSELRPGILARLPELEPLRIGRRGEPSSGEYYLFALPVLWLVEVVVEAFGRFSSLRGGGVGGALGVAAIGLIGPTIGLSLALIPASWALHGLSIALRRVVSAVGLLRARVTDALGEGVEAFREGRAHVSGVVRAEADGGCVAPLSGTRCLGFRIQGKIGDQLVDDADLAPIAISNEDSAIPLRAKGYLVALHLGDDATTKLDADQRERLTRFFAERRLAVDLDHVELRESLLTTGTRVDTYGAFATEMGESDYRSTGRRKVLDDSDGKPVVVVPAE